MEEDGKSRIKDEKLYESLRDEGSSKQKPARIANAAARDSRPEVGERGEAGSYEDWMVDELKRRAKEIGISGYSDQKKDELIRSLRSS